MSGSVPGYNPPPEQGGEYFLPPPGHGRPYASWWQRVAATLIDGLLYMVVMVVAIVPGIIVFVAGSTFEENADGSVHVATVSALGIILLVLGWLLSVAFSLWNAVIRVARKGGSIGKSMLNIEIIAAPTGQHLSIWVALLRAVLNSVLGNACFLNYLWPLWDEQNRTWHDMIVDTRVVQP